MLSHQRIVSASSRKPGPTRDVVIEMNSLPNITRIIDLNKPSTGSLTRDETPQINQDLNKNFRQVVKTAMIVRNWMLSQPPAETNSSGFESDEYDSTAGPAAAEDDVPIIIPINDLQEMRVSPWEALIDRYTKYFTVHPLGFVYYYWTFLVAIGVLYNALAMVIFIFDDVYYGFFWNWFYMNVFFDFIYVVDIFVMSRRVYIQDGMTVKNTRLTWRKYKKEPAPFMSNFQLSNGTELGSRLLLDVVCLLPLDLLLCFKQTWSLVRAIRLLKTHRVVDFIATTLRRTPFPNVAKILFLASSCFILFHWNACIYFMFSLSEGLSEEDTTAFGFSYYKVFDPRIPQCNIENNTCLMEENYNSLDLDDERPRMIHELYNFWRSKSFKFEMGNFSREYSMCLYWSALTITTCGQQPWPSTSPQNMLEVIDTLIGVLVFATIIGSVGSVVTQMNVLVHEFRKKLDGIKFYMKSKSLPIEIQKKAIDCFAYLNTQLRTDDDSYVLECLPPRLQGMIAMNLHMGTLSKVSLFQGCGMPFMFEIVRKVKQQVFSPNDYLCHIGEKATEMYIVRQGLLHVLDENRTIVETLAEDSTFGEMSVIQIKGNILGTKRSHYLRSVGFSDVYILTQEDVVTVLQEFPVEKDIITENAVKWLKERQLYEDQCGDHPQLDSSMGCNTLEEQLQLLIDNMNDVDVQLTKVYDEFTTTSTSMKQRVAALEMTMNDHRAAIKRDYWRGDH